MRMEYRRDMQHSYLVAETEENTVNYITRMITENQIRGLLPCECRKIDCKDLYYYDITSRVSLAEKCRYKKIKGSEVIQVIQGFLQVLNQMEEYLIPTSHICLDWNYIYLDPQSGQPLFCCLVLDGREPESGIRELLEELLPRLDHQEQSGISIVYDLYQHVIQDHFSVNELREIVEQRTIEEQDISSKEKKAHVPAYAGVCEKSETENNEKENRKKRQEELWAEQRKHERALEDFFSTDEDEGTREQGRKRLIPVLAGGAGSILYAVAGYLVWRNLPEYLGTWGGIGISLVLGILIWQLVMQRKRREENQIEEKFAVYQEKTEDKPFFPEVEKEAWEEERWDTPKEDMESDTAWENRNIYENNNYTQVLSAGGSPDQLVLKELHPVNGRQFCVEGTRPVIIGQLKEQADLVLPSTAVSRVHASMEKRAGRWYLKDMNSRNGTWVNEQELYGQEEKEIFDGDQIRFANLIYQVQFHPQYFQ